MPCPLLRRHPHANYRPLLSCDSEPRDVYIIPSSPPNIHLSALTFLRNRRRRSRRLRSLRGRAVATMCSIPQLRAGPCIVARVCTPDSRLQTPDCRLHSHRLAQRFMNRNTAVQHVAVNISPLAQPKRRSPTPLLNSTLFTNLSISEQLRERLNRHIVVDCGAI